MGSVFDGSTKIERAVADPGTDDTLPSSGALPWGGVTTSSGLAGTTGADCKLVHGDRWQQIDGSHNETVSVNVTTSIGGNETRTVMGSTTESYIGNVAKTITANYTRTIIGSELGLNVGPFNRTDVAPVTWLCPTASMLNSGDLYETKVFRGQNYAIRNTNIGLDVATRLENVQVALHTTNLVQFQTRMTIMEFGEKALDFLTGVSKQELLASDANIKAMDATIGAMATAVGVKLDTPPETLPGAR